MHHYQKFQNFGFLVKNSHENVKSDSGYQSVVEVIILCIKKDFHSILGFQSYLKGIFIKVSNSISFTLV